MPAPSQDDRKAGQRVRRKLLNEIEKILDMDPMKMSEGELQFKKEMVMRMAPNTIPRLNEHSGLDGGPIETKQITGMEIVKDGVNENTIQDQESEATPSGPVLD